MLPNAYAAIDAQHERDMEEADRFQAKLEAIGELLNDATKAIYDYKLSRIATIKIMRLRTEEAIEKLKELEG